MESKDDILSFDNNCRICLQVHNQMISINSLKERNELDSLLTCFNIEEIKDNRYPNKICEICVQQLNNTLTFKQKCESSFSYLQEVLKGTSNPTDTENKTFCYLHIKNELPLNTSDDFDNTSVKSEEGDESVGNFKHEEFENFSCDLCNFICQKCDCAASHKKLEHGIENEHSKVNKKVKAICEICNKTVLNLKRHKLTHTKSLENDDTYHCQYCNKQFKTSLDCQNHVRETHEHCSKDVIEKETSPSDTLERDIGEKRFICEVCSRGFKRKCHLTRHSEIHDKELKHFCNECKIFFTLKQTFHQHMKKYHGDNPPPKIACKECGKVVSNIYSHMKRKHSVFEFECKYCKKQFPYKSILAAHIDSVHEKREDSIKSLCMLCGKTFRTNGELNIHNQINHSDELNYQCSYCERRFKTSSNCRKHEKTVHLNNRYKCHLCPKAFTRKRTVANHIRTHTGEKPFVCNICSKAFAQQTTLTTHRKLKHGRVLK